jgi:hypothetical protein
MDSEKCGFSDVLIALPLVSLDAAALQAGLTATVNTCR